MMNRDLILKMIAEVEGHLAQGDIAVEQQTKVIENMNKVGKNTLKARRLLERFQHTIGHYHKDRSRLLRELHSL